jgi:lipopolysaccharide/colanic/teichoic acid biosynthesis glycosyltransferase
MKRLVDIVIVLLVLPLWLPVLIIVGLIVAFSFGRPLFFRQERAGLNGKSFKILKFRTMTNSRDANGDLLPDEDRLTACGRRLRSLSLDELPELLNVLRGDMSLVGPRPLPVRYVARYSPEQRRRLETVPGITGWAQVNGRNQLDWDDRFAHDIWYVDNRTILLDIKILFMTLWTVLRREGISAVNEATMTEFMGSVGGPDRGHSSESDQLASPDSARKSE